MSPVALSLDLLLIGLLIVALGVGLKLNKKLKAMRDGQVGFVAAVAELDSAATRAESALKALRAASEETHDALLTRIETARALCAKLDAASVEVERVRAVAATATPAPARADSRLDPRFRDDRFASALGAPRRPALVRELDEDLFEIEDAVLARRAAGDRR